MKKVFLLLAAGLMCCACHREMPKPRYGMYYWRTTLHWGSDERQWADSVGVETFYLRLFDVVKDNGSAPLGLRPEATLSMRDKEDVVALKNRFQRIVPVVFLAPDVISSKADKEKMPLLAEMLLKRIDQVTEKNGLGTCKEIQLDFDWTQTNAAVYFCLLQDVAERLHQQGRTLSATIRLHQLALQAPPVDRGVLMCYNTGKVQDKKEENSILNQKSVEPYLRYLKDYPLPLAVALPQFSWNVVFRSGEFAFIAPGLHLEDTTSFARLDETHYRARTYQAVPRAASATTESDQRIYPGDVIRREASSDSLNAVLLETLYNLRPDAVEEVVIYKN